MEKKEKLNIGRIVLMAVGFVITGIGGAAAFGSLPDDIKSIRDGIKKEDSKEENPVESE